MQKEEPLKVRVTKASEVCEKIKGNVNKEDDCEFINDDSDDEADNEDEYTEDE